MRIAVLIVTLCLVLLLGMQSCAVIVGGGMTESEELSGAGALGLLMSLLFIFGAALVFGYPKVSMAIFICAALLGWIGAAGSEFKDLYLWAWAALGLAAMSLGGARELKRKATGVVGSADPRQATGPDSSVTSLQSEAQQGGEQPSKKRHITSDDEPNTNNADFATLLLLIPVVGAIGMWALRSYPQLTLALEVTVVILTAALASVEAAKLGMTTDRAKGSYGPIAWFFIISLIWVVGYPAYLHKRRAYGRTGHLSAAIFIAAVFIVVALMSLGSDA